MLIVLLAATSIIVIGVAGQPPSIWAYPQTYYVVGQNGYVVVTGTNTWFGRNVTITGVTVSIAGLQPIEILRSPVSIAALGGHQTLFLPFPVSNVPLGNQTMQIQDHIHPEPILDLRSTTGNRYCN